MEVKFRKALNPANGCQECGHIIGIRFKSGYSCKFCGFQKKAPQDTKPSAGCTCWMGICTTHG